MTVLRNLDLAILAGALAVFLATDLPFLGWVVGAVVWLMWRGVGAYAERKAIEQDDPRKMVGITAGSMVGRGWLLGGILIVAGLAAGDDVGLSAAVLAVILFTVSFTVRLILRPFEDTTPPARRGAAHT